MCAKTRHSKSPPKWDPKKHPIAEKYMKKHRTTKKPKTTTPKPSKKKKGKKGKKSKNQKRHTKMLMQEQLQWNQKEQHLQILNSGKIGHESDGTKKDQKVNSVICTGIHFLPKQHVGHCHSLLNGSALPPMGIPGSPLISIEFFRNSNWATFKHNSVKWCLNWLGNYFTELC